MGQEVNSNVHFGHPKSLVFCAVGLCVLAQSCATLCDPGDCSPPGSSVHGILQARTLEWLAMPFSREPSPPRDQTCVSCTSCIGKWILYRWDRLELQRRVTYKDVQQMTFVDRDFS